MSEPIYPKDHIVSPLSSPLRNVHSFETSRRSSLEMKDLPQVPQQNTDLANTTPPDAAMSSGKSPLRYHWKKLFVLIFYLMVLILPWIFVCILKYRPLTKPSYVSQRGEISPADVKRFAAALDTIRVLNTISALITVPIISAILAYTDIPLLWRNQSKTHPASARQRSFTYLCTAFVILSIIQPPIQQLLTKTTYIQIPTCIDVWNSNNDQGSCSAQSMKDSSIRIARDPEPADMASIPFAIVAQDILVNTAAVSETDIQANLWPDPVVNTSKFPGNPPLDIADSQRRTLDWYTNAAEQGTGYFVAAPLSGTTTGVLREHSIRLNSSVSCASIRREDFPTNCAGLNPFATSLAINSSFEIDRATNETAQLTNLHVSVCAPGDQGVFPWSVSRDRQEIEEEFFVDVNVEHPPPTGTGWSNFTTHCTGRTTRGYFELGNERNGGVAGPLLDKWPEPSVNRDDFNDLPPIFGGLGLLGTWDNDTTSFVEWKNPIDPNPKEYPARLTPGPLTASVSALFGNSSFLSSISQLTGNTTQTLQSVCKLGAIPFQNFKLVNSNGNITSLIALCSDLLDDLANEPYASVLLPYHWLGMFGVGGFGAPEMSAAMFFANQAVLLESATSFETSRDIVTSPGTRVMKPDISLGGMVAVSILIGLQVLALLGLVTYVYHIPNAASSIDAAALVGLGRSMQK